MDNFPKSSTAFWTTLKNFDFSSNATNRTIEPSVTEDRYSIPISVFSIPGFFYKFLLQQGYRYDTPLTDILKNDSFFDWQSFRYEASVCFTNTWHIIHIPKLPLASDLDEIPLYVKNDEDSCRQVSELMVNYLSLSLSLSISLSLFTCLFLLISCPNRNPCWN